MKEYIKQNKWHILLILLGTIFIFIPAFHTNIWFDESYSVGIVTHSFADIWKIGSYDVHPILYYWMLKVISLIFGQNILVYRIFSALGIVVLGILGLTHIRKDFGKKTGLLFTFFSFFLPVILNYALEIRMYSWTIVFVTLMAIYLYRFIKQKNLKNIVLFGVFSIISCYMHYYALACAGILNLGLIIYVIRKRKEFDKKLIKQFIAVEIVQVLLYLPWFICFVKQFLRVGSGFWITLEIPQIFIDVLNFQYMGNLNSTFALVVAILLYVYIGFLIYKSIKNKEDIKPGIISILVYIAIVIVMFLISLISPILYARYLFTITGLLIFFLSFFMAKEKNKYITIGICVVIAIMAIVNNVKVCQENYDESNGEQIEYLKENLQSGDIIIYKEIGQGGVVAVQTQDYKQYFVNLYNWSIEEAYKAYAPQMEVAYSVEEIENNLEGRLVIIDTPDYSFYNNDFNNKDSYNVVSMEKSETKYKNIGYGIIILEKKA